MGKDKPRPVEPKSAGDTVSVKEDCVLEDETGAIMAHIWNPLIDDLENGQSYIFKNLTVKITKAVHFSAQPLSPQSHQPHKLCQS